MTQPKWQQTGHSVEGILSHRESRRKPELLIDWEKYTSKRGRTVTWKPSLEKVENFAESEMFISYLRQHKLQYATVNSAVRTFGSNERGNCVYQALKVTLGLEITCSRCQTWEQTHKLSISHGYQPVKIPPPKRLSFLACAPILALSRTHAHGFVVIWMRLEGMNRCIVSRLLDQCLVASCMRFLELESSSTCLIFNTPALIESCVLD